LLIDAGTTLNEEDIGTLRLLYEAGIPALVLLSKSDLMAEAIFTEPSRTSKNSFTASLELRSESTRLSSVPAARVLLDHFFERELLPRFERSAKSARGFGCQKDRRSARFRYRRTGYHSRSGEREGPQPAVAPPELEARLRLITGEIGELGTQLDQRLAGTRRVAAVRYRSVR